MGTPSRAAVSDLRKADLSSGRRMGGLIVTLINWDPLPLAVVITLIAGVFMGALNAFYERAEHNAFHCDARGSYGSVRLSLRICRTSVNNKSFWARYDKILQSSAAAFLITIVLLVVYGVILKRTRFGRQVYMTGGNANAARLAGINPKMISTILYINSGMIATIAGILTAARVNMGSPTAIVSYNLDAITVAVLGGISFTGGTGSMSGVFIGILLFNSFKNGLVISGLDSYYQIVASGLLLMAALILDFYREKSRLNALRSHKRVS